MRISTRACGWRALPSYGGPIPGGITRRNAAPILIAALACTGAGGHRRHAAAVGPGASSLAARRMGPGAGKAVFRQSGCVRAVGGPQDVTQSLAKSLRRFSESTPRGRPTPDAPSGRRGPSENSVTTHRNSVSHLNTAIGTHRRRRAPPSRSRGRSEAPTRRAAKPELRQHGGIQADRQIVPAGVRPQPRCVMRKSLGCRRLLPHHVTRLANHPGRRYIEPAQKT